MSKTALKKELKNYTVPQLIELICEAYDAKVVTKEYFEFFLNPDVDKLCDRAWDAIEKETLRTKRRMTKFRISRIKAQFDRLKVFNVDASRYAEVAFRFIKLVASISRSLYFPDTQKRGVTRFLSDFIVFLDRNELLGGYIGPLLNALDPHPTSWENRSFRASLRDILKSYDPTSTLGSPTL